MRRMAYALRADIIFQWKQGFYYVYIFITLTYMMIVRQLPESIARIGIPLIVFSDPSLVGFFFIGGIVMLEKVQGILQYLVVTPLRPREYLVAKVLSLALLAEVAGFAIALTTSIGTFNYLLLFLGILLCSMFFTLYGFLAVAGCDTVNQYFIRMIPYMLLIILPCFSIIGFPYGWIFDIFPSVAGLKVVYGAFHGIETFPMLLYLVILILWNAFMFGRIETLFVRNIIHRGEA